MVPRLSEQPPIASYAGMRCHCEQGSYTIRYNDGWTDGGGQTASGGSGSGADPAE